MGIDDLFTKYQRKIGTYDKQLWEKTIERRILNGLTNVEMRSTKPNTELIDLDLIRGSSFTKAKPKHGIVTVVKLATLRYVLFPVYAKWWLQQTSRTMFIVILCLYVTQLANLIIYCIPSSSTSLHENIALAEIIVPLIMMWILSFIHSQIVSTNPGSEVEKTKTSRAKKHYRRKRNFPRKPQQTDMSSPESMSQLRFKTVRKRINWKSNVIFDHAREACRGPQFKTSTLGETIDESNDSSSRLCDNSEEELIATSSPILAEKALDLSNEELPQESEEMPAAQAKSSRLGSDKRCGAWVKNIQESTAVEPPESRYSTDTESDTERPMKILKQQSLSKRRNSRIPVINITSIADSTCDTEDEGETLSSPETTGSCHLSGDFMTSGAEWMGVTTNTEDCSCTSDLDDASETHIESNHDHMVATAILTPPSAKVSCTIWERKEIKKAELSVLEICSAIISKVESMPNSKDYFYIGLGISTFLAFFPAICRVCSNNSVLTKESAEIEVVLSVLIERPISSVATLLDLAFGSTLGQRFILVTILLQRWVLSVIFFFLLSVAERTFKQRFLYAKLFTHLTSSQRARKSDLPHFRLNKVRNIKTWLSVRSYLKKRGPQRSIDVIVSASFIIILLLLSFLCLELLKDTVALNSQYNLEVLVWSVGLGAIILRFMTLGTKINKKYRNLSVLITEQINLHLQIEQKPHKKDELTVANNVLKLAIDLLKELDSPFKIYGLSANPILYNVTKVIILSALSGVLSEMLGFKLKLHKIKLK